MELCWKAGFLGGKLPGRIYPGVKISQENVPGLKAFDTIKISLILKV